jgi:hypothetical protein
VSKFTEGFLAYFTFMCVAAWQRGEAEIDPRTGTNVFGGSFVVPPR